MFDFITAFGEFVVGIVAIILVIVIFLGGLVELYDHFTGADEKKQEMQARLKSVEEDQT